jgi:NADPH:quinone reductase-like Zn-dependent oxidoreductase
MEQAFELTGFGLENLTLCRRQQASPGPGEVRLEFQAASLNPRDLQIIAGQFTPDVPFPLVPLSDGAGRVVEAGEGVTRVAVGDLVTPLFFPRWLSGEALADERQVSLGLEAPGVLRESGVFDEQSVVRVPAHLAATEAACLPCAWLTAWTALVDKSGIGPGDTVLVQGTGGVATAALLLAGALGASAIVLSSSDQKLARAAELGADHTVNYVAEPDWGPLVFGLAGHGVDAVIEIGGAGTLANSLAAIRHGGHVNVIGYMAGAQLDTTVFPFIIKNANLHGIGTGNRDGYQAMLECIARHELRPVIDRVYPFEAAPEALADLAAGGHFGKLALDYTL